MSFFDHFERITRLKLPLPPFDGWRIFLDGNEYDTHHTDEFSGDCFLEQAHEVLDRVEAIVLDLGDTEKPKGDWSFGQPWTIVAPCGIPVVSLTSRLNHNGDLEVTRTWHHHPNHLDVLVKGEV